MLGGGGFEQGPHGCRVGGFGRGGNQRQGQCSGLLAGRVGGGGGFPELLLPLLLLGLAAGEGGGGQAQLVVQGSQGQLLPGHALFLLIGFSRKVLGENVVQSPAKGARLAGLQVLAVGVEVGQCLLGAQLAAVAFQQLLAIGTADFQMAGSGFGRGQSRHFLVDLCR